MEIFVLRQKWNFPHQKCHLQPVKESQEEIMLRKTIHKGICFATKTNEPKPVTKMAQFSLLYYVHM